MILNGADYMLDLETLDTKSTAVIVSIGCCRFDQDGTHETFYQNIDVESCFQHGLTISPSTLLWWLKQPEKPRMAFFDDCLSLYSSLIRFTAWLPIDARMGGNGVAFDNEILRNAYRVCDINPPWDFRRDRDYRTFKQLHPELEPENNGIEHNALDDAKKQALHLINILKLYEN